MIELHPFVYFLPRVTRRLIIGSFPCFNGQDYGDWFYSGSGRNEFWRLLSHVFEMPAGNLNEKKALCEIHGIALTDVAYQVERKANNCADSNLRIIEFNRIGMDACLAAQPDLIYFTGKFVERHFFSCYPYIHCKTQVLVSPSPAANRYLSGLAEYKHLHAAQIVHSPYEYRQIKYRQALLADHEHADTNYGPFTSK